MGLGGRFANLVGESALGEGQAIDLIAMTAALASDKDAG